MSDLGSARSDEDPARQLRISDAERENVLRALLDAMGHGMITPDELAERTDTVLRARTRGEIESVTRDLPLAQPSFSSDRAPVPVGHNEVLKLRAKLNSVTRKGFWVVPRKLVLRARMGSTELDFTEARIDHPVVDIAVNIKGGSVQMRLPAGASVTMDDIDVMGGSVEDHRKDAVASGRPHFVITGRVRWGSVELRGPHGNTASN